jgi:hypothetical protein
LGIVVAVKLEQARLAPHLDEGGDPLMSDERQFNELLDEAMRGRMSRRSMRQPSG